MSITEEDMKKHISRVAGFFMGLSLLVFFTCSLVLAATQTLPAQLQLSVSHQPTLPFLAVMVAAEKDFFRQAGLKVDRKVVFSTDIIRSGMEAGQIEIGALSIDSLIRSHAGGFDFKLVYPAVFYDPKSPDVYLVVRSDLPYASAKDLEGKTVAVTFGSIAEAGVKAWLRANGAELSKVKFVEIRFPDMVGALEAKRVHAAHIVEPFLSTVLDRGLARIFAPDLDVVGGRFLVAGYAAKDSWLLGNPEKAQRFARAVETATRFILENPKEALQILSKETRISPENATKFFPKRFVASTQVRSSELQLPIDFSAKEGFIDKVFDFNAMISKYVPLVR